MKIICSKREQGTLIAYLSEYCMGYGKHPEKCKKYKNCTNCLKSGGKPTCMSSNIEWEIVSYRANKKS